MATFTAGDLTVSGFDNSSTDLGLYNSSRTGGFAGNFGFDDDFVWNWSAGTDANGNPTGPQIVSAAGTNSWSLHIEFQYVGGNLGAEELQYGGSTVADADNHLAANFTGTGADSLTTIFQNLNLYAPAGAPDSFAITFTLTDTTAGGATAWTQYFENTGVACYATGTRIATPAGEVAVEALRIGDLVATSSGVAKPIKWIGRRTYTAAQVAAHQHLRPVTIRKDALAEGMPHRDLVVSPMHAMFIDDVFIPAAALINGVTVLRNDDLAPVSYVHIELDAHDVVFAEGAPAETFVDDNSRLMFDNADEYYDMFGADEAPRGFSAPRVEEGYQLEAVRRRLAARAGIATFAAAHGPLQGHVERLADGTLEGWVLDTATPSVPVELDVLVDGETVARVLANRYRTDLDHAGLAGGRCAYSVALPASVVSIDQVEVRRVADGARLPVARTAALAS
ncbi:Hint domain-containing protein [Limobrevibacterium gyesilva]|uniref:Hint domain-containing protein n=1 Tax=Limobrevibacterium gyesilva TaxID=2991712 RepID=A0AA41YP38_9PROT|nr:Hint domain-containing protein [Limobrevibacterium gyesilva]MCW3477114.1 Hint domain-containing protein [Limobrevibacterium gyesilva]